MSSQMLTVKCPYCTEAKRVSVDIRPDEAECPKCQKTYVTKLVINYEAKVFADTCEIAGNTSQPSQPGSFVRRKRYTLDDESISAIRKAMHLHHITRTALESEIRGSVVIFNTNKGNEDVLRAIAGKLGLELYISEENGSAELTFA